MEELVGSYHVRVGYYGGGGCAVCVGLGGCAVEVRVGGKYGGMGDTVCVHWGCF